MSLHDYDVFISYTRKDDAETGFVADYLWPSLLAEGLRVRIDKVFPLGGNLVREVEHACERSAKILAIVTRNYAESDWGMIECSCQLVKDPSARDRRIIPIVLDVSFNIPPLLNAVLHFRVGQRADWQDNIQDLISRLRDDAREHGRSLSPRQILQTLQSNIATLSSRLRESRDPKVLNELLAHAIARFHIKVLSWLNVPETQFFVDSDGMMAALAAALDRRNVASVAGIPGIGKTYLAAHYARAEIDHYSVLWIAPGNRPIETPDDFIAVLGDQAGIYGDQQIAGLSKAVNVPWEDKIHGITDLLTKQAYLIVIDDNNLVERDSHAAQYMLSDCLSLNRQQSMSRLILSSRTHFADLHPITLRAWDLQTTKAYLKTRKISVDDASVKQIHDRSGGHPEFISALCDLHDREPLSAANMVLQNSESYPYQLQQVIRRYEAATLSAIFAGTSTEDHCLLTACALLEDGATDEMLDHICCLNGNRDPIHRLTQQLFLVRLGTGALSVGRLFKNYLTSNSSVGHFEAIARYYLRRSEPSDAHIGLIAYQGLKKLSKGETRELANTIRDRLVLSFISREHGDITSYKDSDAEVLANALSEFEDTPQCGQWQDLFLKVSGAYLNAGSYEKAEEVLYKCHRLAKNNPFIQGDVYKELARISELKGDYKEDLSRCDTALSWFRQGEGNPERTFGGVVDVLTTMGTAYFMMGDYNRALQELAEAERMIGGDFAYHKQKRARIRLMKGAVCCRKGEYANCDTHLNIAYQLFSAVDEEMGCAGVLINRGIRFLETKDWEMAREILREAMALFSRHPHKQYSHFALNELATVEKKLGRTRLAVDLYLQSLSGKVEIGDAHGTADTLLNLSEVTENIEGPHKDALIRLFSILDKRFAGMLERDTRDILTGVAFSLSTNLLASLMCDVAIQIFSYVNSGQFLRKARSVRENLEARAHASRTAAKNLQDRAKSYDSFSTLAEAGVRLQYSPATCALRFVDPDSGECILRSTGMSVRYHKSSHMSVETAAECLEIASRTQLVRADGLSGEEILFKSSNAGICFHIIVRLYEKIPFALLQMRLTNRTGCTLRIESLNVLTAKAKHGGRLLPSSPPEQWCLLVNGFQSWSPTYASKSNLPPIVAAQTDDDHHRMGYNAYWELKDIPREAGHYISEMVTIISGRDRSNSVLVGFISGKHQFSYIEMKIDPKRGFQHLQALCIGDGCVVKPGEEIESEPLMVCIRGDGLEQLETWANATRQEMSPHIPDEKTALPLGWCSWHRHGENINQQLLAENLRAIASCPDLGVDFILLDDGYQAAVGDWLDWQRDKFPGGVPWLVSECQKAGVKPGLWLAPFLVQEGSQLYNECRDKRWLVSDESGEPISTGKRGKHPTYALDTTHPDVKQWIEDLLRKISDKGFKYIKLDFLYAGAIPGCRHDASVTRAQAYRKGLEAMRKGAPDAFLIGCGAPFSGSIGLVDAMRIGPDVDIGWRHFDKSSPGAENAMRNVIARAFTHRRLWLSDPDAYILRSDKQRLDSHELLSINTAFALSGGMVSIGDDLKNMISAETTLTRAQGNMLRALLPSYGRAAGVARRLFHPARVPMIDLTIVGDHDGRPSQTGVMGLGSWHIVGLFNMGEDECSDRLDFVEIELSKDKSYHVYDFWKRCYLGLHNSGVCIDAIPRHGCRLLGIRPEPEEMLAARQEEKACLLSSLRHYTQGGVELHSIKYDFRARLIDVGLKYIPGGRGELVFFFGADLADCEIRSPLQPASFQKIDNHVVMIQVSFYATVSQEWTLWRSTSRVDADELFYTIRARVRS